MEKGMENGEEKMGGAPPVDAGVRARRRESASWGFLLPILLLVAPPASVTLAQPTPAAAQHAKQQRHAPQGYGKATFGITLDQARALYPALTKAGATAAAYFRSPNLTRYWMTRVKVPGLTQDCSVEFRFWKDRLWSIVIFYGTNKTPDVLKYLEHTYGPPTVRSSEPTWTLGSASIVTSPGQMWYSFDDTEIGKDVQREFMEAVQHQHDRKAAAAAAPGPAATPTAVGRATPATTAP